MVPLLAAALLVIPPRARSPEGETLRIGASAPLLLAVLHLVAFPAMRAAHDPGPVAARVAAAQDAGRTVAWTGRSYQGELHFPGRLRAPLVVLDPGQRRRDWLHWHPEALVVVRVDRDDPAWLREQAEAAWPWRTGHLALWRAGDLDGRPLPP